ncbi:MAG: hypothetical protein Q4A18_07750 [Rikenellaceae bacterium]|nr:hypothetical protein [Rikenellaceae bacterium]
MKSNEKLTITLACNHPEWWRFNVNLQAETLNGDEERIDVASLRQYIAEVGSNLPEKPAGVAIKSKLEMTLTPSEKVHLYYNIIPHTHPDDRTIANNTMIELRISIRNGEQLLLDEKAKLNPWSGGIYEKRF